MKRECRINTSPECHRRFHWFSWLLRLLLLPLLLVVAVTGSLYVPGVLNFIASKALPMIEKSAGYRIEVADIGLHWPLRLSLSDATVIDLKADSDTMVTARQFNADLCVLPLLKGDIRIAQAVLYDGTYRMGTPDTMFLRVRADSIGTAATVNLANRSVDVDHADLSGAGVLLLMGPDTTTTPEDTVPALPWHINVGPLTLRNVDYRMSMALTNDTIAARVNFASLSGGNLTTGDTIDIAAGTLRADVASGLYGQRGARPVGGLDLQWLTLRNATLQVDSFRMHGTDMTVPLTSLTIKEVCGLSLNGSGTFAMDPDKLYARHFDVEVNKSRLWLNADVRLNPDMERSYVNIDARTQIYPADVVRAMPALLPLLKPLPANVPLLLRADAAGTMNDIRLRRLEASMRHIFKLSGSGSVNNVTNLKKLVADVFVDGELYNSAPFGSYIPKGVKIPPLGLRGKVKVNGNSYNADITARTARGTLALDGYMRGTLPDYDISLRLNQFPVAAFMPDMGIGTVTGSVTAAGRGFNPLRPGSVASADIRIASVTYQGRAYDGITVEAECKGGDIKASLNSGMPAANLTADLAGHYSPRAVSWNLNADVRSLDLRALGITDSVMGGRFNIITDGYATLSLDSVSARADIKGADIRIGDRTVAADNLKLDAVAGRHYTSLTLSDATTFVDFNARQALQPLMKSFTRVSTLANQMIAARSIAADSLTALLPPFELAFEALPGNILYKNAYWWAISLRRP